MNKQGIHILSNQDLEPKSLLIKNNIPFKDSINFIIMLGGKNTTI